MPAITIKLQSKHLEAAKIKARRQGFKNASEWAQFLIEKNLSLEESPKMDPSKIISEMKKTDIYQENFLRELKKSLEYADKAN
ncbi:MAG: hypothetical protein AAB946_01840 [Patescibacteria group bacterium]